MIDSTTVVTIGKTVINSIPESLKEDILNNVGLKWNQYTAKELLSNYLDNRYESLSKMKTLLYKNPVLISDFYIPIPVKLGEYNIKETSIVKVILENKKVIISGGAGLGKSVFCKSIFLNIATNNYGVYPIFIELRDLNISDQSLIEYICNNISYNSKKLKESVLERMINAGNLILILDGFDELNFNLRGKYTKEILFLSDKYKNLKILVSSRPDISFKSWNNFIEISMGGLNRNLAIKLISKLEYDEDIKKKFISKLRSDFYDLHESFVINPLLLTMMFLTFEEYAEIPNRIHLFYEHAFRTLYHRHDALKSLFKRDSKTKLDISEFSKIFSYFCLHTHVKQESVLNERNIIDIIEKSIHHYGINIKPEDFLSDLMHNLCLIQRDGLDFVFTHRSFQEYFCALYLLNYNNSDYRYAIFNQVAMANENKIINILYDMNPYLVENYWIKEKIRDLLSVNINEYEDKKNKIERIINIVFIKESSSEPGKYYLMYNCKSTEDGYDNSGFNKKIWDFYYEEISFSKREVHYLINSMLILTSNEVNDIFDGCDILDDKIEFLGTLKELYNKLSDIAYKNLINYLYEELIVNSRSILEKISSFIDEKNTNSNRDISELLAQR